MPNTAGAPITPDNSNTALESLREIGAPADISWLPQTLGWQLLLLALFCYLLYRLYLRFKRYMHNAYRRAAIIALADVSEENQNLDQLPLILRRTALYGYKRKDVAPLTNHDWEVWLDKQCANCQFSTQYSGLLNQLSYQASPPTSTADITGLKLLIIHWIKHHRGGHD